MVGVDNSCTDYQVFPDRIHKLPQRVQVWGGTAILVGLGTAIYLYKRANRKVGRTGTKEWHDATLAMMPAWPREAAGPVEMNPIRRRRYPQNYPDLQK
ncbi:hypothetical protein FVE85_0279 [Porphyridium purpureum]|uniref:Uncharacterized protein n=1 Tax=Porphyridium purpureum TaxID=35688 RepID=A0A5J4YZV8_PORPP|nr:hypothetical protein FVE85_0279 [Porphyridium purpureum]|eukprot:POR5628..scf208_2